MTMLIKQMRELDTAGSLTALLSKNLINQISSGLDQVQEYDEMINNIMKENNLEATVEKYYLQEIQQQISYSEQTHIEVEKYVDSDSTGKQGEQEIINSKDCRIETTSIGLRNLLEKGEG